MEDFPPSEKIGIPFEDNLIESGISETHKGRGKLFEFEHNPDKVIRIESFDALEKRYHGLVDPITVAELGKELYKELENIYGIAVPVEYVVGKDSKDRKVVYGVTDKIEGKDLDKIGVTPEITAEVEKLYTSISQYYLDKLPKKDELYLADINNASQYVYGKRKGDEQPKIYLVDTDLYMRDGKASLYNVVLWLVRHMGAVEEKYNKKFDQARKNIEQILNAPLPETLDDKQKVAVGKIIAKTKSYLDGIFPEGKEDVNPLSSF